MIEAGVRNAGTKSAIDINERRKNWHAVVPWDIGDRHLGNQPFSSESEGKMMKTAFALFLVLAVALTGLAPSVSLAENPSNYVVLKGGLYSPSKDFDIGATHFELDDGFVAEIAAGHYFVPFFATELGVGYFESKASPAVPPGETKFKVVPVTLTGKVLFPFGPIEPYGEFGIGAYITKAEVSGTIGNFSGSTKGAFGLHAGGGANINITPNVFLGAEGRYLWAKPSFGGQDIKLDGFTVTGNLGYRF
jgi:opacity protein-like surface antigen